jgi:hypothetical protein
MLGRLHWALTYRELYECIIELYKMHLKHCLHTVNNSKSAKSIGIYNESI